VREKDEALSMRRLAPEECVVLVIDVQERLAAAMPPAQMAELTRATTVLVDAATRLGARVLATEQYPTGLGPTIAPVAEELAKAGVVPFAKIDFSACDDAAFERAFSRTGARAAIVVGMETHVCVFQTVRELAARGVDVFVPMDGVASRRDDHRAAGLDLCRGAGATITTMESVVFDWLRRAGSDAFKHLSKRIR
jgi:nicotinamidase-related amidase